MKMFERPPAPRVHGADSEWRLYDLTGADKFHLSQLRARWFSPKTVVTLPSGLHVDGTWLMKWIRPNY